MLLLVGTLDCRSSPSPSTSPTYAGSAACVSCHEEQFERWRGSMHAAAAQLPTAGNVRSDFDGVRRPFTSGTIRPARQDGAPRIETSAPDGSGAAVFTPALVVGTKYVEQLLVPGSGGRLQVLPNGYDPVKREWFDVFPEAPGPDDWAHWTNPGANANAQCLECHVTGYEKRYHATRGVYESTWIELGVGCEGCHGPGSAHVKSPEAAGVEPYGALAATSRMPGCPLCHSRRVVLEAGYIAGAPLEDYFDFELLDADVYHADGQVRGEAYEWTSFQMSRMAANGVRCGDCHDAHSGNLLQAGNRLCLGCHEPSFDTPAHTHHAAGTPGASCVECHMPPTVFMERDVRRDHLLARPDPERSASVGAPDACTTCHGDKPAAWAATWFERWWGISNRTRVARAIARVFHGARVGVEEAVPGLIEILTADGVDAVRRASAARLLAEWSHRDDVKAALLAEAANPIAMMRAAVTGSLGEVAVDAPAARDAVVRATRDPRRAVRLAAAFGLRAIDTGSLDLERRRDVERAFAEWIAAGDVLADSPEVQYNRGVFWTARGDATRAEAAYRAAIALWPHDLHPRQNLAMLLSQSGRPEEAEREFQRILERSPDWSPAAFALGLLYAEQSRWVEAAGTLERCLAANPRYPRAAYNLGIVLMALGRDDDAVRRLEEATADPASRLDALRRLVQRANDLGNEEALQRWVSELLLADPLTRDDPRVRAALEAAESPE